MKKTLLIKISILSLILSASVSAVELAPSVIISSNASEAEYSKLINIVNNSVVYSVVTNKILNGSGNNSFMPVKPVKPMGQILDQLSFFDLYLQKSLKQSGLNNLNLEMHLLPLENKVELLSDLKSKQAELNITNLVDSVRPLINASIKFENLKELYAKPSLDLIRQSQILAIQNRYPAKQENVQDSQVAKTLWLASSFLPLSVSSQFAVTEAKRQFKSTLIFPALGFPKMLNKSINGAIASEFGILPLHLSSRGIKDTIKMNPIESSAVIFTDATFYPNLERRNNLTLVEKAEFDEMNKSRALRVELIKDLNRPHVFDMALSFGYLPKTKVDSVNTMNVDEINSRTTAQKLIKNSDFAMVLKGNLLFDKYLISNDWIREKINDYYSSMFEIRLVFHKVYMEMDRLPIANKSLKYLENPENQNNLDLFLNKDIGFDVKNLKYNSDKSIINVIVSIKPEVQKKIEDGSYFSLDANIRRNILTSFCIDSYLFNSKDKINDSQLSKCQIITSSINEFKSNFIAKFINQTAMKYLNIELKSSVQYQAGQSEKLIDTAIEEVMVSLMGEMQAAKTYVFDVLSK